MKIRCSTCPDGFTELADDVQLAPDFIFTCSKCIRPDNRVKGFIAHDPRLRRSGKRPGEMRIEEGFQFDRKTPKPIRGPEWAYSDAFLRELLAHRSDQEKGRALLLICGRWRQHKTFKELAAETHLSIEDARQALSGLRSEGNALWRRNVRAEKKARKHAELSARAKALFDRGLTVRQVADILDCSVGYASELRSSGERTATVFTKPRESGSTGMEVCSDEVELRPLTGVV